MRILRRVRSVWLAGCRAPIAALLAGLACASLAVAATVEETPPVKPGEATEEKEKPPSPWTNTAELSLVVTEGNSAVRTAGLKYTLEHKNEKGRAWFRMDALRSDTSDDPYLLVIPGLTFQPGETIPDPPTQPVRPGAEPDVARFFSEGRYEGNLSKRATWSAGASWDMDQDAGILSRTIVFGGYGHKWRDLEDLKFRTNYGLSWTDRIEDVPDPEKEQKFLGARLSSYYKDKWGKGAIYENNFTLNISLHDFSDYNANLLQSLSVNVSKHLALKVSLLLSYAGEPALEDVDVIARAELIDPDGIPGTGDEFYQTVEVGGVEVVLGEATLRREALDTTFSTGLQINY